MIDPALVRDIISTYEKHGWAFRRVLLSDEPKQSDLFSGVAVVSTDLDAAWFSRTSNNGATAWEIRHLSTRPLAFLTVVSDETDDLDARLSETEGRLRDALKKGISSL